MPPKQEENLNLDYNIKRIICKALNSCSKDIEAAKKLGISKFALSKRKIRYGIIFCETEKKYLVK